MNGTLMGAELYGLGGKHMLRPGGSVSNCSMEYRPSRLQRDPYRALTFSDYTKDNIFTGSGTGTKEVAKIISKLLNLGACALRALSNTSRRRLLRPRRPTLDPSRIFFSIVAGPSRAMLASSLHASVGLHVM